METCRSLRRLFCGGEVLSPELLERCQARLPVTVHNQYGPTETSVNATFWTASRGQSRPDVVPIGRPIANIQIYVLDRWMAPVAIGVPGELHIGGLGLARGYVGRPDLTAERFVPNPFADSEQRTKNKEQRTKNQEPRTKNQRAASDEGATQNSKLKTQNPRLYKTGDLVRYRPDGTIEFLGRIDQQVKIRGFRVELGEIENVLGGHPGVRKAAVIVREDIPGDRRLVAYIVRGLGTRDWGLGTGGREGESSQSPIPNPQSLISNLQSELRTFLKEKLPDYMVPSAFVLLDALPLTSNGKIDRKALPAPDALRPATSTALVAPRNEIERAIAEIWQEVLRVDRVGIYDNFFDLGGHSLLATQLISRLRRIFTVEVPLRRLFEQPTVAQSAEVVEELLIAKLEELPDEEAERLVASFLP